VYSAKDPGFKWLPIIHMSLAYNFRGHLVFPPFHWALATVISCCQRVRCHYDYGEKLQHRFLRTLEQVWCLIVCLNKHLSVIRVLELNRIFIRFVCSYIPMITKHYVGKGRGGCEYNINMYYFIWVWYSVVLDGNNICAQSMWLISVHWLWSDFFCFLFAAIYSWKCWLLLDT